MQQEEEGELMKVYKLNWDDEAKRYEEEKIYD
jgi:hypothetical protein